MNKYFTWIFALLTSLSLSAFASEEDSSFEEVNKEQVEEVAIETNDADIDSDQDEVASLEEITE